MGRIAITGANGFVGRHMVRGARGRRLVGRRDRALGDRGGQVARDGGARSSSGRDPEALAGALEGCDALVHLAQIGAERGGQHLPGGQRRLHGAVLEAADCAGVPSVVYFSGLGVARYGISRRATNAYFLSKLAAETILMRSGLDCVVFRPSFIVGPGDAFVPDGRARARGRRLRAPRRRLVPDAADRRRGRGRARARRRRRPAGVVPDRVRPRRPGGRLVRPAAGAAGGGGPGACGAGSSCACARSRSKRRIAAHAPAAIRGCFPTSSTACSATRSRIPRRSSGCSGGRSSLSTKPWPRRPGPLTRASASPGPPRSAWGRPTGGLSALSQ